MNKRIGCPQCKHLGFEYHGHALTKPQFRCDKCGNIWMSGKDGEPYISELDRRMKLIPNPYIK